MDKKDSSYLKCTFSNWMLPPFNFKGFALSLSWISAFTCSTHRKKKIMSHKNSKCEAKLYIHLQITTIINKRLLPANKINPKPLKGMESIIQTEISNIEGCIFSSFSLFCSFIILLNKRSTYLRLRNTH